MPKKFFSKIQSLGNHIHHILHDDSKEEAEIVINSVNNINNNNYAVNNINNNNNNNNNENDNLQVKEDEFALNDEQFEELLRNDLKSEEIPCPICGKGFKVEEIENHAANCLSISSEVKIPPQNIPQNQQIEKKQEKKRLMKLEKNVRRRNSDPLVNNSLPLIPEIDEKVEINYEEEFFTVFLFYFFKLLF